MKDEWDRFKAWLSENCAAEIRGLNDPATSDEFDELESIIAMKLPDDFKQYLTIHNGQGSDGGGIVDGSILLSTVEIIREWESLKYQLENTDLDLEEYYVERDDGLKGDVLNSKWIPFVSDRNGNYFCLDLDPAEGGSYGQIIDLYHDDFERNILSVSFKEWFSQYVSDLEDGEYVYDEDYSTVMEVGEG